MKHILEVEGNEAGQWYWAWYIEKNNFRAKRWFSTTPFDSYAEAVFAAAKYGPDVPQ